MHHPSDYSGPSQWLTWLLTSHLLLNTPEKAVDLVKAVHLAYGADQVTEECPLVSEDLGEAWRVQGQGLGSHAIPFIAVSSAVTLDKRTGAVLDYTLSHPPSPEMPEELTHPL